MKTLALIGAGAALGAALAYLSNADALKAAAAGTVEAVAGFFVGGLL